MKIRYFLIAMMACISFWASAQTEESDPMYMVLTMRNGQLKAVDIDQVSRLTFPQGNMDIAKKDATSEQIVLTEIETMAFSNNETNGVESLIVDEASMAFDAVSSSLLFNGVSGKTLAVYNTKGALVLSFIVSEGVQSLDLTDLYNGVYIVTYNGNTLKIKK